MNNQLLKLLDSHWFIKHNNFFWKGKPVNPFLHEHKNTTVEFLYDDEREYFLNKIANNPNHRYYSKKVLYTINGDGFRESNIPKKTTKGKIACFGCSCTFGLGLADDETWPYILSSKFNHKFGVQNFGIVGGSCDTIARLISQYMRFEQPDYVFVLFPSIARKEYITERDNIMNFNVTDSYGNQCDGSGSQYDICRKEYKAYLDLINVNESFFAFLKNFFFIESLLKGVKWYWGSLCGSLPSVKVLSRYINVENCIPLETLISIPNTYARDGIHHCHTYNEYISEKFYELYYKNNIKNT